ncbi:MAG: hypothetical protein OJJ54_20955, partial [Pseudonocardia sp.]|nr:hypothetical protein [Pseudonocardia sp.]
ALRTPRRPPDVLLPVVHGHHQPLGAAYRTSLAEVAAGLLDSGRGRPPDLFAVVDVHRAEAAELLADPILATLDPNLDSLTNVNTPGELADAVARPAPAVPVDGRVVRAASLGEVGPGTYLLNAATVVSDPHVPLVTGDALVEIDTSVVRTTIEPV